MQAVPPPSDLRCEYAREPVGVDPGAKLRFTWVLYHPERGAKQRAYQVIVSSSRELAEKGVGDVWDSGVVESGENVAVYGGPPLESSRQL